MSTSLSPPILKGAYEFLRTTPPFSRWNLLPSESIIFVVGKTKAIMGDYHRYEDGGHGITISDGVVGTTYSLITTMAHEMIHLAQYVAGTASPNVQHNADFYKRLRQVAKNHGFDSKWF